MLFSLPFARRDAVIVTFSEVFALENALKWQREVLPSSAALSDIREDHAELLALGVPSDGDGDGRERSRASA